MITIRDAEDCSHSSECSCSASGSEEDSYPQDLLDPDKVDVQFYSTLDSREKDDVIGQKKSSLGSNCFKTPINNSKNYLSIVQTETHNSIQAPNPFLKQEESTQYYEEESEEHMSRADTELSYNSEHSSQSSGEEGFEIQDSLSNLTVVSALPNAYSNYTPLSKSGYRLA
jgi:hypothetical protein